MPFVASPCICGHLLKWAIVLPAEPLLCQGHEVTLSGRERYLYPTLGERRNIVSSGRLGHPSGPRESYGMGHLIWSLVKLVPVIDRFVGSMSVLQVTFPH
ncbi:hypothetical protein RSAG8_01946, partial [Rhizoctonia solani AG-8 WAC10335]